MIGATGELGTSCSISDSVSDAYLVSEWFEKTLGWFLNQNLIVLVSWCILKQSLQKVKQCLSVLKLIPRKYSTPCKLATNTDLVLFLCLMLIVRTQREIMILFVALLNVSSAINCADFVLKTNVNYATTDNIKTTFTPRGHAQCEEECRKLVECAAYSMQKFGRKQCILHREATGLQERVRNTLIWLTLVCVCSTFYYILHSSTPIKVAVGYISGTKAVDVDFQGNIFDINYCRERQRARQCQKGPECSNYCPIGYKTDELGCLVSCECRNAEDAEFVYGDLVLTPEQIQDKLTYSSSESDDVDPNLLRGVDIRVSRWDNIPRDGKYYIPYTKHRLPWV